MISRKESKREDHKVPKGKKRKGIYFRDLRALCVKKMLLHEILWNQNIEIVEETIRYPILRYTVSMEIEFTGKIWFWKGPAPWFLVTVPEKESRDLKEISRLVTYGWVVIPVHVRIGRTEYQTSLFPKDGRYIVPIKASVRKTENLEEDNNVTVHIKVQ